MSWCGGHEGGGLSGSVSGTRCAGACEDRGMCGRGSRGLLPDLPGIQVFLSSSFFFLSGWATNTLLCPCPFMHSLSHGGRVCAISSQESMCGN